MIDAVLHFVKEYPVLGIPVMIGMALLLMEALFHRK